jgi:S-adenosylmethionine hydrolase
VIACRQRRAARAEVRDVPGWLTFLSDYGLEDAFVGVCKGVIARTAPDVQVIDVCHAIGAQDVLHGASTLAEALPYLPVGVHLALVDPPAPEPPRVVAVRTADGSTFVAPDNGISSLAWPVAGGVEHAHAVTEPSLWLPDVHRLFRGRDVVAPVAAHVAAGRDIADVGPVIDPDTLVEVAARMPRVDSDHVRGEVRAVDHFGNVRLSIARADLEAAGIVLGDTVEVRMDGRQLLVPFVLSYGDVPAGQLAVCEDHTRHLTLAVNLGRASDTLRARRGDPAVVSRIPQAG